MDRFNLLPQNGTKGGEIHMNKAPISLKNVALDYPRAKKGAGFFREIITKRFKRVVNKEKWFRALDKINLEVMKGEVVGIIGPNGSGKSTLLRVIAGIYAPDEGRVEVQGRITLLAGVGTGFNQNLTGRENISLTASIYGFNRKAISAIEERIIEFSGIRSFIDDPMRTYSAGMRARLGFAIISNLNPDVLLMDEVMSVGDHEFKKKSRTRIEELVNGEATVVIVSHSKAILKSLCSRVYYMREGQIMNDGDFETAFELYETVAA